MSVKLRSVNKPYFCLNTDKVSCAPGPSVKKVACHGLTGESVAK